MSWQQYFKCKFASIYFVNMFVELNKLNQKLKEGHVDITYIDTTLYVSISMLRKRFLESIFGVDAMHMSCFLVKA